MAPHITIFGAGSVGCFVGGLWRNAGLDVTLIGRPAVRDAIRDNGLRLTGHDGLDIALRGVPFETGPSAMAEAGLVVVTVKSTATAEAANQIAAHATAGTPVLSLQNGISNVDILREALPGRTVLRGMVGFNVAWLGDGRLHKGTSGLLAAERHTITEELARTLRATPGELALTDEPLALAWGKLLLNLNNAINALSGKTLLAELSERPYRRVLAASMREALAVLAAAGIAPARVGPMSPGFIPAFVSAPDFVFNTIGLRLQKIDANARSSMADDFAAGRPTEIDFLNGEVVRLAESIGRSAPVNAAIVDLVREAEGGTKRRWTGEDLLAHIGA
ncbi:2-dehydropantoate 2-reductase [Mesorhizobium sp. Z1-4]|uniref:2-dehydropantoate 2-reductase n=1 Tax=Mesorhizobium sp. Z1-4 TaxID=2448478 RepID=UPI0013DF57E4|nr:2-dehydropantoate 2-reductase [Mesorhizobium sp. Z1-4]